MDRSNNIKSKMTLTHIILLLICLAAMNAINAYYYFIFIAFGIFCLSVKRILRAQLIPVVSLLLLAVSWDVFSPSSTDTVLSIFRPFSYVMCYLMGTSLYEEREAEEKNKFKLFYLVVGVLAFGSLIHYILNWMFNINTFETRNTIDFWTRTKLAATGQAAIACLPLALATACLFSKNNKMIKLLSLATLIVVLGYNLILSGRTLIILILVIILAAFLYKLSNQQEGKLKTFVIFLLIITLLVFLYQINLFGIKSMVESSPMYNRFFGENSYTDIDEDSRMERKLYYLQNMWDNVLGGSKMREYAGYAHDIYFDTYDEGSVFAFVAMIAYILSTFVNLIKCLKNKNLPFIFRQIVWCTYLTLYIEFWVEPILQGTPWMFASFCLIDGYVSYILSKNHCIEKV